MKMMMMDDAVYLHVNFKCTFPFASLLSRFHTISFAAGRYPSQYFIIYNNRKTLFDLVSHKIFNGFLMSPVVDAPSDLEGILRSSF